MTYISLLNSLALIQHWRVGGRGGGGGGEGKGDEGGGGGRGRR